MLNAYSDIFDHFNPSLSTEEVWESGSRLFEKFGSFWLTAGAISRENPEKPIIRTSVPPALMTCYLAQKLDAVDPWLQHCRQSRDVISMDVRAALSGSPEDPERRLAEVFEAFGARKVVIIPVYSGKYSGGLALYATDTDRAHYLSQNLVRADFRLAASVFANAYRPYDDRSDTPEIYDLRNTLSPRECETLCWLANGMATSQIATQMGIAPVSVTKNLASIRRKLGTSTREHSLVVAIRLGLINP